MTKINVRHLHGVPQTLWLPLAVRAAETQRPDGILHDPKAVELVDRIDLDFAALLRQTHDRVSVAMRAREFDRCACAFFAEHPDAVVVHIGCGLDTRFQRVDNGVLEWYDLDLPAVIAVRQQLLPETPRAHLIGCSVLELAWMESIEVKQGQAVLLLAEGLLMYLTEAEVKRLVCALRDRFPGSELVFDAFTPAMVRLAPWIHPSLKKSGATLQWGLGRSEELESWADGIELLSEWFYSDQPEPRFRTGRFFRWVPGIGRGAFIVRYRLGRA